MLSKKKAGREMDDEDHDHAVFGRHLSLSNA